MSLPAPVQVLATAFTTLILTAGGWCAFGWLTVRSVADPSRVGVTAPWTTALALLLIVAALASASHRRGGAAPSRSLAAALLMAPLILPWLPVSLPPIALLWTGPLGVAWWCAGVACTCADLWPAAFRRVAPLFTSHRRAPLVAGALTGLLLTASAWHTSPQHPKGDEPDYLIVTQSLLLDRDLRIENNHARADYFGYHRGVLPPSYLQRGVDGQIYSVHAPGLSALLVPAFALAGYPGTVAALILVAMGGAWLAWRVCWQATASMAASWYGVAATVGAATFFLHAGAVFPDAPASVLALVAVALLVPAATDARPIAPRAAAGAGAALAVLPWLHTRYAILAGGLGLMLAWRLRRDLRALVAFAAPALVAAAAWLGFFWVIYGRPDPSAPYGAYTQMAVAHLAPGLLGLLADQQFGLLFAAPALTLAGLGLRDARYRGVAMGLLAVAVAYVCAVGAYRMWWGGLSAPARFLAPLVLPLAPLVAIGWTSVRTRSARWLAVLALILTLATTTAMVVVEQGALAYNTRDGRALLLLWLGPIVDLVSAFPAAHRDAPALVARDVAIWLACAGGLFGVWRWLESRGWLSQVVALASIGVFTSGGVMTAWTTRGAAGLAPLASQAAFLAHGGAPDAVEFDAPPPRGAAPFTALRIPRLPAGTYVLHTARAGAGVRLGAAVGEGRADRFLADVGEVSEAAFELPLPVQGLVVKASRGGMEAPGRVWITARTVDRVSTTPATRMAAYGERIWLLPAEDIHPEASGLWLGGDADVTVGVTPDGPIDLHVRAGAAPVTLEWWGRRDGQMTLAAGEVRRVTLEPTSGRLRLRSTGGFRPANGESAGDQRWLGVWLEPTAPEETSR